MRLIGTPRENQSSTRRAGTLHTTQVVKRETLIMDRVNSSSMIWLSILDDRYARVISQTWFWVASSMLGVTSGPLCAAVYMIITACGFSYRTTTPWSISHLTAGITIRTLVFVVTFHNPQDGFLYVLDGLYLMVIILCNNVYSEKINNEL